MATKGLGSLTPLNRCLQNVAGRAAATPPHSANMATIASFRIPKVLNEPNVSYL
jgi:hypothetical protein